MRIDIYHPLFFWLYWTKYATTIVPIETSKDPIEDWKGIIEVDDDVIAASQLWYDRSNLESATNPFTSNTNKPELFFYAGMTLEEFLEKTLGK